MKLRQLPHKSLSKTQANIRGHDTVSLFRLKQQGMWAKKKNSFQVIKLARVLSQFFRRAWNA